jgi:hypothetical protein
MSMIDAQHAATERLRKAHPRGAFYTGIGLDYDLIVSLYLAEHPADDAEPVTEEWLSSVVGRGATVRIGGGFTVSFYLSSPPDITYENGVPAHGYGYESGCTDLPSCPTRGDVRRLCYALGVPLKSQVDSFSR